MKLGGNAAAALGLNCKIGSSAASGEKYSTRAALDYKQRLANRVKADKAANPMDAFVDVAPEVFAKAEVERPVVAPVVAAKPVFAKPSPTPALSVGKKPLGKKLGAVKSVAVDFDQLENQAKEEEPVTAFVDALPPQPNEFESIADRPVQAQPQVPRVQPEPVKAKAPTMTKDQEAAMGRLGMGMKKLSLQQKQSAQQKPAADAPKSISSEKMFKQTSEEERAVIQEKLRNARGQSSISSNDFFAKPGEEDSDAHDSDGRRSASTNLIYIPATNAL